MATSSYFPTSNNYIKYWFEVIQTSQSISGNYSTVTVKVWAKRTNTGYTTWGDGSVSCTINGTAFPDTGSYTITSTPVCLRSVTGLKVNHNSDGTKSLTVSGSISIPGAGLSSSSHSFTTSLTTIPRTSSFSLSSSSVNAGSAITVNITRASSSFTHKVNFSFGSHSVSLGSSVATSVSYTIPISYLDAIPSSTSGSAKIVVDTYSGSTKIGSTSKTFTITAPSSVVPSFSSLGITRVDNGVPSSWGIYVKTKSKATLTINGAAGMYGSSISKYSISGGAYSTTSSSFTTGVLNTVGTNTFTATITDSRGRTATKTVTCSVVDYFTPRISYVEAFRCNSSGVTDENGTYIKVRANFTYASLSGKNTFSSNVYYAIYNSGTWGSAIAITNNVYSVIGSGAISIDNSYDVRFRVADYFTSNEVYETVSTPSVTMDFKKGGKGIAVGKVAETDNLLDIAWNCGVGGDFSVDKRTFLMGMLDVEGFASFYGGMNSSQDSNFLKDIYVDGWVRSKGTTGLYFQDYGGGWRMNDSTWLRSYNDKSIYTGGQMNAASGFTVSGTAVVASGSASTGNWVRFYDGTQIVWRKHSNTYAVDTALGSVFYKNTYFNYPVSFVEPPSVSGSCTNASCGWIVVSTVTTTKVDIRIVNPVATTRAFDIDLVIVGRWK